MQTKLTLQEENLQEEKTGDMESCKKNGADRIGEKSKYLISKKLCRQILVFREKLFRKTT